MHVWCRAKDNTAGRSEGHASIAGQQASHIWETRAHNKQHRAGSKPITHQLQK